MIDRPRQSEIRTRRGFTLVELLVAMAIFVILATLTVAAFRGNQADRVGAAAATFKNALEGARNGAINTSSAASPSPRGIRLIPDPNDGRIARSFVYLDAPTLYDAYLRIEFRPYDPSSDPYVGRWVVASDFQATAPLDDAANSPFEILYNRGLLTSGTRIEIPTDSGRWYTMYRRIDENLWELLHDPGPPHSAEMYHRREVYLPLPNDFGGLVTTYHPADYDPQDRIDLDPGTPQPDFPNGYPLLDAQYIASLPLPFRLKLPPTILPGSEPTLLPEGVAIDLDGSDLPGLFHSLWRPDPNNPYSDSNGNPNVDFYSPRMDIMFSPRGTLFGAQQSQGLVHFRIAYLSDIELDRTRGARPLTVDSNVRSVVPANPQKDHKAVSIYTETGQIVVSEIYAFDGDVDGIADDPFRYAVFGREAK